MDFPFTNSKTSFFILFTLSILYDLIPISKSININLIRVSEVNVFKIQPTFHFIYKYYKYFMDLKKTLTFSRNSKNKCNYVCNSYYYLFRMIGIEQNISIFRGSLFSFVEKRTIMLDRQIVK